MLIGLLVVLIILWFLGYISIPYIPIPNIVLFTINGQQITLWNLIIFLIVLALVEMLPRPLNWIAGVILIFWLLSTLGILAIPGLASILVIVVIVGLIIHLLGIL